MSIDSGLVITQKMMTVYLIPAVLHETSTQLPRGSQKVRPVDSIGDIQVDTAQFLSRCQQKET